MATLIKPLTPGELAELYNVSVRTLKTWLRPFENRLGPRTAKYFTVIQVKTIYCCIGSPSEMDNDQPQTLQP